MVGRIGFEPMTQRLKANIIDKILSHINKKLGNNGEVLKTFSIRGPPELVALIISNNSGESF